MNHLPCLGHVSGIINCLPFNLNRKMRRIRMGKDPSSTCVDFALQIIESNPGFESGFGLEYIQAFLVFVRNCNGSDEHAREHLAKLVSSIEDAFETAGLDLEWAIRRGDAERLNALRSELEKKIKLFKARIKKAYDFSCSSSSRRLCVRSFTWSCLDSAIEIIREEYHLDHDEEWKSVTNVLELIQIFLIFAPGWSNNNKVVGEHLGDLSSSIEDAFKTAGEDLKNALNEGDAEGLDAIRSKWVDKIEIFKPQIREAYEFFSDYAFEVTTPLLPIIDPNLWTKFCDVLVRYAAKVLYYYWGDDLSKDFIHTVGALKSFGYVYIKQACESNRKRFQGLGSLIQGVTICLARLLFLWCIDGMDQEDVIIRMSDLLQRVKLASRKLLHLYVDYPSASRFFSHTNLSGLVGIILPPSKSSLQTLRYGLEYVLRSYSMRPEDVKLLRSDIEIVFSNAASISYSYILAARGDDELLFQLLQKILLLNIELVLTKLIRGPGAISTAPFESIFMGLSSVQAFLHCSSDVFSVRLRLVFNHIEELARQAESLHLQFQANERRHSKSLAGEFKLYLQFKLLKIQASLTEQMRCSPSLMVLVEDKFNALDDGLKLLLKHFSLLPSKNRGDEDPIWAFIERVAGEETPPYYFSRAEQFPQHFINGLTDSFSRLLQRVNLMNSEIQDSVLQFQTSLGLTLPKSHLGLGFVDIFLEKLSGLLIYHPDSSVKPQIRTVQNHLESLRSLLIEVREKRYGYRELMKDIQERVVRAAYKADYTIDRILLVKCDLNHMLGLSNVIDEMKGLASELTKFTETENDFAQVSCAIQTSEQIIMTQTTAPEVGEADVVLEDQQNIIINQLTRGISQRREVVTISGMAGIGKTTLAKKVYDNLRVKKHFHVLAWCCVSQVYRRRELLLKILSDITRSSTAVMGKQNDEELLNMLYKGLKGKRYLIVLDDVWETQVWEDLRTAFSDDHKSSRILITTRNEEVGIKAQHNRVPHALRFLNGDESWKLLQQKVFHKDEWPEDLLRTGMEIAKGCKGLPLAIVAVAGILKTTEKSADSWKQIEKDLNSHILENPEIQCMHILELSYNFLPDGLKQCFLYFAAFGEDSEVPVQKLIQLWIGEGFIGKVDDQKVSPEDVAESYVVNLIGRSLLMAVRKGSNGRVKTCKVHDMVYNLCLRKVEEENFLLYINGYENLFPSSNKQLDYGVDSEYLPIPVAYGQHRLSIHSKRKHFVMLKPLGPFVRTLLFFATSDAHPTCPYDDISFIMEKFKILTVLDIESINIGSSFPKGIELLYPLRYLAISGDIRTVPSSIAMLWNLEILVVKGLMGKVVLPYSIWGMSRLRHLHVSTRAIFNLLDSSPLDNIVSLSCPTLSQGDDSAGMMKLFPKLRKLKCTFSERMQHSEKKISFPVLVFLVELEALKIIYYGMVRQYCQLVGVSLPVNLKKLSLSEFNFTWDDFSAIGELPNLKILKLVSVAFDSPIWEMRDDEFQRLEYLKLDSLKITQWNAEFDHLPNLQQLVLQDCTLLEEVPSSFGEIITLDMIEMKWCSVSAEKSVVTILEQQLGYGNSGFKAFINGFFVDPRSSTDD